MCFAPIIYCFCRPTFRSFSAPPFFCASLRTSFIVFAGPLFVMSAENSFFKATSSGQWWLLATTVSRIFEFLRHLLHHCQLQLMFSSTVKQCQVQTRARKREGTLIQRKYVTFTCSAKFPQTKKFHNSC